MAITDQMSGEVTQSNRTVDLTLTDLLSANLVWDAPEYPAVSSLEVAGPWRSRLRGLGLEFDATGPFQEGDDFRHIDWYATARSTQVQVRRFYREAHRPLVVAMDLRSHLYFGCQDQLLARTVALVAAGLIRTVSRNRRPVALIRLDASEPKRIRVSKSKRSGLNLVSQIQAHYRDGLNSPNDPLGLPELLERWRPFLLTGCDLIVVSDYSNIEPESPSWMDVTARGATHGICVEDRMLSAPFSGWYPAAVQDGEVDVGLSVSKLSQEKFDSAIGHWREELTHRLNSAGVRSLYFGHAIDIDCAALRRSTSS